MQSHTFPVSFKILSKKSDKFRYTIEIEWFLFFFCEKEITMNTVNKICVYYQTKQK